MVVIYILGMFTFVLHVLHECPVKLNIFNLKECALFYDHIIALLKFIYMFL